MPDIKEDSRLCERDGSPMVKIRGRWECVGEYLARCIGHQRVVDLVHRGKTIYYVFEDGHELPLLCFCCGEPLVSENLKKSRRDMKGRRLERISIDTVKLAVGEEEVLQLQLGFSGKGLLRRGKYVPVSIEVAAKMRHPSDCPYKGSPKSQKKRR